MSLTRIHKPTDETSYPKPTVMVLRSGVDLDSEGQFNTSIQSLLDRGVLYVACDVRPLWTSITRMNGYIGEEFSSTNDLLACIQHLFKMGYTTQDQLAIIGSGSDALVIFDALRQYPDWIETISLRNPMLSMTVVEDNLSTIERQSLQRLVAVTPYENVLTPPFPNILVWEERDTEGWQSAGWIAKLRARSPAATPLLWNQLLSDERDWDHSVVESAYLLNKFQILTQATDLGEDESSN